MMKQIRAFRRIRMGLLLFLLFCMTEQAVLADDRGSITIKSVIGEEAETAIPNLEFELYSVGEWKNDRWILKEPFAESQAALEFEDSRLQDETAERLTAYIDAHGLRGERLVTDEKGCFVKTDAERGVYLAVLRSKAVHKGISYRADSSLFTLPLTINGEVKWETSVEPKFEQDVIVPTTGPNPTGAPNPTATPKVTGTPEPTVTPKPMETPTATPDLTATPKPTGSPKLTAVPKLTTAPKPTSKPTAVRRGMTQPVSSIARILNGTPKTGDTTVAGLWVVLLLLSGCVIGRILRFAKENTADRKE